MGPTTELVVRCCGCCYQMFPGVAAKTSQKGQKLVYLHMYFGFQWVRNFGHEMRARKWDIWCASMIPRPPQHPLTGAGCSLCTHTAHATRHPSTAETRTNPHSPRRGREEPKHDEGRCSDVDGGGRGELCYRVVPWPTRDVDTRLRILDRAKSSPASRTRRGEYVLVGRPVLPARSVH